MNALDDTGVRNIDMPLLPDRVWDALQTGAGRVRRAAGAHRLSEVRRAMLIENKFEVAAPVDEVWKYITDVPRLAPCLPGAELTEVVGDGTYKGKVTTKMGPVSLRFAGTAQIVEQDEAARRMVLNASGSEEKGKGRPP